ncbi:MAG TPA: polysaccharide deacetylase family protein [bacterium]|nr:polysaccharide deacetylase family protein [bacterium]
MRALWLAVVLGLCPAPGWAGDAPRPKVLAVVCYHRFGAETEKDPYRISLARLDAQLDWLVRDGWANVTLDQVAEALRGHTDALPAKGVLLTVDDGYKAGALGAAHFEAHGYRGVYFVNPGSLGSKAFLSWGDLKALEARGHVVASHTSDHPNMAKVPSDQDPGQYAAWAWGQLAGSRRLIEQRLGHPVTALAWPFGAYNPALVRAARRAGYTQLYTVSGGLNLAAGLDGLRLRRILLMGHPSLEAFIRHLRTLPVESPPQGLAEGDLIYQPELPRGLSGGGEGLRAVLGNGGLERPWRLPADLGPGFHYLVLETGDGAGIRRSPLLFQVAPQAWKPYFDALDAIPSDRDQP